HRPTRPLFPQADVPFAIASHSQTPEGMHQALDSRIRAAADRVGETVDGGEMAMLVIAGDLLPRLHALMQYVEVGVQTRVLVARALLVDVQSVTQEVGQHVERAWL